MNPLLESNQLKSAVTDTLFKADLDHLCHVLSQYIVASSKIVLRNHFNGVLRRPSASWVRLSNCLHSENVQVAIVNSRLEAGWVK